MTIIIIISFILLLIDQLSKFLVINNLQDSVTIINNFFSLTKAYNEGAAWSILDGKRLFLILISIIVIVILITYIKKNKVTSKLEITSFALILGGTLGNLIDRIFRGYVVDFLDFKILTYDFPIFNLADTFIVIGTVLLFIITYRKERKK